MVCMLGTKAKSSIKASSARNHWIIFPALYLFAAASSSPPSLLMCAHVQAILYMFKVRIFPFSTCEFCNGTHRSHAWQQVSLYMVPSCQPEGTCLKVLSCLQPFPLSLLPIYHEVTSFVQPFSSPKRICLFINSGAMAHKTTHCPSSSRKQLHTRIFLHPRNRTTFLPFCQQFFFAEEKANSHNDYTKLLPSWASSFLTGRTQCSPKIETLVTVYFIFHTTLTQLSVSTAWQQQKGGGRVLGIVSFSKCEGSLTWDLMEGSLSLKTNSSNRSRE